MIAGPQWLLIGAVAAVGVLHTVVPDHWVPEIPAFFAAGKYGFGQIAVMALVFAISTIATYIALCVTSVAGLQRISLGPLERYGEVFSGAFIALVGLVFLIYPVL